MLTYVTSLWFLFASCPFFMSSLSLSLLCSVFSFCGDLVLLSSGIFFALPVSLVRFSSSAFPGVFHVPKYLSLQFCSLSCRCDIPSCCVYSCLLVCSSSSLPYVLFATYQVIKLSVITLWGIVYKCKNIVYFYSSLIKAKTRLNIQCAKKCVF